LQLEIEKRNWERMFEVEIEVLGAAYRKTQLLQDRAMTSAGLILPQANLRLNRKLILNKRRLHITLAHSYN
jgi:hypothetical protein